MPEVHLQLFGRFQVRRGAEEVAPAAFGGRKVRTLLRVLAVRRPDLVPHDVLVEALWPDRPPADPVANLNVLVNRARRAVGDPAVITTGPSGYALGAAVSTDLAEFEAAVRRARAGGAPRGVLRAATAALALWGEPLAEDTYADWARATRERLRLEMVEACELAAEAALTLGETRAAAATAADAVAADPLRESAVSVLARARAGAGDRAGALEEIARFRARLADELGLDPTGRIERLQRALLQGEPPTGHGPAPSTPTRFDGAAFVGRDGEVAAVRAAVAARSVVVVAGAAGTGKSRLLAEALRGASLPVVGARAFLPERDEAWGLARSLLAEAVALDVAVTDALPGRMRAALGSLLPDLGGGDGSAEELDRETRRALLLATGARLLELAAGDGAVLVVDDLQWADPSSATLIGSALARLPRTAAVLAHRPGETDPDALATVVGARAVVEIELGPLSGEAIGALVDDPALADALRESTDRTPFAVVEVLREVAARGAGAGADAATLASDLGRQGRRRAVALRVRRQSGARAQLLALVALVAREIPARALVAAVGSDPRGTLSDLSELARAGLLRLGERGWAPAHDLVGETVVETLEAGERGRLHGLLAVALDADGADPAEVARHQREAGDADAASRSYLRAARRALEQHATREAGELAATGLLLDPGPAVRSGLLDARAESRAAHGRPAGAIADLRTALAVGGPGRARRMARLAMLTSGAEDLARAGELAELALVESERDPGARAAALETAAVLDMNLGHPGRSRERSEEALRLYRRSGDAAGVARILDGRAMATFLDGRVQDGVALFARVAQLFSDSGDLLRVITPRSTRGHGLVFADRPDDGLAETTAALQLARELDAAEGQAYALWHRSEALSALGRTEEAEHDGREALRISGAAGHRGWTATAHRAIGIALQTRGDLDAAAASFAASGEVAGDTLTLFACWAAARSALVAVARGALTDAVAAARRALATGPPLGRHEARWAWAEVAAARGDPDASSWAARAVQVAEEGGVAVIVRRLAALVAADGGLRPGP